MRHHVTEQSSYVCPFCDEDTVISSIECDHGWWDEKVEACCEHYAGHDRGEPVWDESGSGKSVNHIPDYDDQGEDE